MRPIQPPCGGSASSRRAATTSRRDFLVGVSTTLAALAPPAFATPRSISVVDAVVTPTRGLASVNAIYFRLINPTAAADRLLSVTVEGARAEIHMHEMSGGMMQMRRVDGGVMVPRNGAVAFEPGGLHVMLFGHEPALAFGDRLNLTLRLERAGQIAATATCASAGGGHAHR